MFNKTIDFFKSGDTGITETVKLGGTVLDEVTEWIRSPVGYLFHFFEGTYIAVVVLRADMQSKPHDVL